MPLEKIFDLADLTAAGQDIRISADLAERARIAQWAAIPEVRRFDALVSVRRIAQNRFAYKAQLTADVVQNCVVSLAPVEGHIAQTIARELHLVSRPGRALAITDIVSIEPLDEDGPEDIESTRYDLAGPLLEEFLLSLDPYPRAPGVAFESPEARDVRPESPFAVLKTLKNNN